MRQMLFLFNPIFLAIQVIWQFSIGTGDNDRYLLFVKPHGTLFVHRDESIWSGGESFDMTTELSGE
jgi:hypothetical protein